MSHAGVDEGVGAVGDEEACLARGLQLVQVLEQRVTVAKKSMLSKGTYESIEYPQEK